MWVMNESAWGDHVPLATPSHNPTTFCDHSFKTEGAIGCRGAV